MMKNVIFLAFLTLFLMEVSILPVYLEPIWNGTSVNTTAEYPYMCGIFSNLSEVPCGCAILSENFALTSAQCFDEGSLITPFIFFAGNVKFRKGEVRIVLKETDVVIHPDYNVKGSPLQTGSNLAVIKLTPSLTFTDNIQSIRLPGANDCRGGLGRNYVITGWGSNSTYSGAYSENLLRGKVKPVRRTKCKEFFRFQGYDYKKNICSTKPSGVCLGDYGGPLAVRKSNGFVLCGVIDIGDLDCSTKHSLYTRVSYYNKWICEETYNEPAGCSQKELPSNHDYLRAIGAIGSALPVNYTTKLINNQNNLRAIGAMGNAQNLQNINS